MQVEFVLLVLSLLFFISILTDKIGYRLGVPALLLFLSVGMLFGPDGIGKWIGTDGIGYMVNVGTAQALGTVALSIILFSGGMDTKITEIRRVLAPGVTLATLGVLFTMLITGLIIDVVFDWMHPLWKGSLAMSLLIAATMSSTDSASVFSILRTNGVQLKHGLKPLLELESGANDPMAYILTITLIGIVTEGSENFTVLEIIQNVLIQLVMGGVMGFAFGKMIVQLLKRVHLSNQSLYPIMVLSACVFIFAVTYYLKGNPYLAVYIGGLLIGNTKFARKRQTKSFFDGLTWLAQLVMFLMLGLMVRPLELMSWQVAITCLIISFVMIFVSRPLSVFLCMWPFKKYKIQDRIMLSWVGLKGAVPIIFAILCVAENVPNANMLFNVVFACTLFSLLVQGTTLNKVAKRLHLVMPAEQEHRLYYFDIDLPEEIESLAREREVDETLMKRGNCLKDLAIPKGTLVIMVRRGENFFIPTGTTELRLKDQLLIISDHDATEAKKALEKADEEENDIIELQFMNNTIDFVKNTWRKMKGEDTNDQRPTTND